MEIGWFEYIQSCVAACWLQYILPLLSLSFSFFCQSSQLTFSLLIACQSVVRCVIIHPIHQPQTASSLLRFPRLSNQYFFSFLSCS
ncbi:hypothetical protein F5H01DRAFT_327700 [Linnemannia elongata]|nr:hypothetical protein F5H01DRAFT_327700 [Linnemannia elongata]